MTAPRWANEMLFWNDCLWFHVMAAGLLSKIAVLIFPAPIVFIGVCFVALEWELLYDWGFGLQWYKVDDRDFKRRYTLDSIGDVLGAVVMAGIVLW